MNLGTIIALIGVALLAVYVLKPQTLPTGFESVSGRVSFVTDGDTIRIKGYTAAVRLWGINAPETTEAGWHEARGYLLRIAARQNVTCEIMHYDKYGRTVARCYLPDGRDLGALMIEAGHAVEMRGFSRGYYSRNS